MSRWTRRLLMISLYCLLWAVLTAFAPLWVALACIRDILGRYRFASTRLLACIWVYLACELLGLLAAGVFWLAHRGMAVGGWRGFIDRNHRLQAWWTQTLLTTVTRAFSMRIHTSGSDCLKGGPILLFMRHASILDTLIPGALLSYNRGYRLRYVLKRELLIDPCLDVIGNRLPNHFVDRGGESGHEVEAIGKLALGLEPDEGVLIYPEGTRFSPARRARALEKVKAMDPARAASFKTLNHVLPPRSGGVLALLAAGDTDVVFCSHRGLEGLMRPRDLLRGMVVGTAVEVSFWRVRAADIPATNEARRQWLD
ncbi:MAG: lysophospholipid acyltransferase family protein, partial [Nannocystaceae bacterium]